MTHNAKSVKKFFPHAKSANTEITGEKSETVENLIVETQPRKVWQRSMYDIFAVCFVSFLLISNIGATKLIDANWLVFDGGAILFPLTYIIGDVLSEVYGFARARRAIILGFVISILAAGIFWIVIEMPAVDLAYQESFAAVLGVVPRFVAASLFGYLAGQLLNSYVLVRLKAEFGEKNLWVRLIGSTLVGEFVDTIIFCLIAWVGVESWGTILNLTITGIVYKVGVEVVLLPVTYAVIRLVKRYEIEYQPLLAARVIEQPAESAGK